MDQDVSKKAGVSFAFIRDEASDQDFFGSHDRVAEALASVIRENADLRVVGLLGPWGSGKSTVVKLVQAQLKKDEGNKTFYFYYDAWLHQSDPPRRSFLETLIHFLVAEKLTTHDEWKDELGLLNRQVEDTETTSTPTLTRSGRFIIASLFLLPLGMQFVSHEWYDAAFGANKSPVALGVLLAGILLLLLPGILAFGIYFSWRPTKSPFNKAFWTLKNWSQHNALHAQESIFSLFMNKEVQRHRNRVTRSPDPTAIEFQDVFRKIMEKVSGDKRRFLFVIDNLDRLPEAEAVAMWGTIRSFFLGARETNHIRKATQLPTVILPIDGDAVERMYKAAHDGDAEEFARSFMDKTFDLTFRVTPPVLSDWNAYLAKQLLAVFGEQMPGDWPYLTGRLYERFLFAPTAVPSRATVTPRTINILVNDIATLWLQWQGTGIAFVSVAYYAVYRSYNDGDIERAIKTPLAGINELDPDWQRAVAALHYGVNPADAVQVFIEQRLRKAISDKDLAAFREIAKVRGYEPVFQRIIDESTAVDGLDPGLVLGATMLLEGLNPEADIWVAHAWRTLRALFRHTGTWKALGPEECRSIKALISHCDTAELDQFVSSIGSRFSAFDDAILTAPSFSASFIDVWNAAVVALRANKITLPRIMVPGSADAFVSVAMACQGDSEMLKQLTTKTPDADVVQQLSSDLQDATRVAQVVPRLNVLLVLGRKLPWESLITAAGLLVQDQNANNPSMPAALSCLGILRPSVPAAKARIQQLVDGGQLLARLNEAHSQNNDPVAARAVALLMLSKPDFAVPENGAWDNRLTARPQLVQLIDDALVQYDAADNFDYLVAAAKAHPSLVQIVRSVITLRVLARRLGTISVPSAVAKLEDYLSCIAADSQDNFIQQIAASSGFWEELKKATPPTGIAIILHALIKDGSRQEEAARRHLRELLDTVSTETWSAALETASEPLKITAVLATYTPGGLNIVGAPLYDALEQAIGKLLSSSDENFRVRWFQMAAFLGVNARHTLYRNVRDKICIGTPVPNLPLFLRVLPDGFLVDGNFAGEPDGAARHIVIPMLSSVEGIDWLIEMAAPLLGWVSGSDATTRQFLAERLSALWSDGDDAQKERLKRLQSAWSLPELPLPAPDISEEK